MAAAVSSSPLPASAPPAASVDKPILRGLSLTAALQSLQQRGLPIVFATSLVLPTMRVEREPEGESPGEVLDGLLRPHGLRAVAGAGGRLVVVRARAVAAADRGGPGAVAVVPKFAAEIVVKPDPDDPSLEAMGGRSLAAAAAVERPNRGDDLFRALGALPGTTLRESSARVHVRGGRDDDVLILLDGLELLAPYHLQEFDSALSIVSASALERADLVASGYPAEYGDRMGGLLDLTTATPARRRHLAFGLGLMSADAAGSGRFAAGRGAWYGAARGGAYRLALELEGRDANPRFWDTFAKVEVDPRPGHSFRLSALVAADELGLEAEVPGGEAYRADWSNRYAWGTHHGLLRPTLAVESIASVGEIERRRGAGSAKAAKQFTVKDRRSLRLAALKQLWRHEPAGRIAFEGGFELRELGSTVEYFNQRQLAGALAPLRTNPARGSTAFSGRFDFDQVAAFATARLRLDSLTSELGLRYDRDTFIDEEHVSPRLNLAWTPGAGTVVRLAWGWFYQSQRPNELQVEDGETLLRRAERAEHRVLALEQRLPAGVSVRVEAFDRRISRGRARFDNLFDPVSFFPELEEDRVRIAPERGFAEGVELGIHSTRGDPASWRLAYTYATAAETVDGRQVPRAIDQRHALHAGLGYRTPAGWSFDTAWSYHSGWPTTEVWVREAAPDAGATTALPVLGPLNGARLPSYHRLDLRVGRNWSLDRSRLSAYLDLQNVYDRQNLRGATAFRFETDASGRTSLRSETTTWGGLLPSFGLRWTL